MNDLLTKSQAAGLLGVSLATFDRRKWFGLQPAQTIKVKPIKFLAGDVTRLVNGNGAPAPKVLPTLRQMRPKKGGAK